MGDDNQISIIKALSVIAEKGCQVVLTTHSTTVMRQLPDSAIRLVKRDAGKTEVIKIDEMKGAFRCLVEPRAKVEVGYLYLGEAVQEYHNLLYGFVTSMGQESNLDSYVKRNHKEDNQEYSRSTNKTGTSSYGLCMSVRDHIHHPENKALSHLTEEDVVKSIDYMREYWMNIGEKQFTYQPKGKAK